VNVITCYRYVPNTSGWKTLDLHITSVHSASLHFTSLHFTTLLSFTLNPHLNSLAYNYILNPLSKSV